MFNIRTAPRISRRATVGMTLLAALAIGAGGCGAGGATHASTAPAPASPAAQSDALSAAGAVPGAADVPAAAGAATQSRSAPAVAAPTTPTAPKTATTVARTGSSSPHPTTPAPTVTAPAPTTPALPARRQPSAAEVNQVIASVHALIPLFTPSPAQIAQAGNQVCTAFDQGKSAAQVKAAGMQMAGVYAALVPAGVADSAVRTIVTLFCPGYASKLG